MKVTLKGYIEIPTKDLTVVLEELPKHIALTLSEPGCTIFSVARDETHKNRFNVHEEFTDQSSFEFHQERVKHSHWGKVSKNVKRNYRIT